MASPSTDYAGDVPSAALAARARALPPPAPPADGVWSVPIELVLPFTSSAWGRVIRTRRSRGLGPLPVATVHRIRGRLYAAAHYADGHLDLFFPLDLVPQSLVAYGTSPEPRS